MVTSERKAEIARANGRKSKGPLTPHGKLMSSINGLKHGLEKGSPAVMLVTDDAREYRQFVDGLTERYDPQSPVETHLIEVAAMAMIRQRRLWQVDAAQTNIDILKAQHKALYPDRVVQPAKDSSDLYFESRKPKVFTHGDDLEDWRHTLSSSVRQLEKAIANTPQRDADVWSKQAALDEEDTWLNSVYESFSTDIDCAGEPWSKKVMEFYTWLDPWAYYQTNYEDDPDNFVDPGEPPTVRQIVSRAKKTLKLLNDQLEVVITQIKEYDEVNEAIETAIAQSKAVVAAIDHQRFDLLDRYQRTINRDLYGALDRLEAIRRDRINENSMIPVGSLRQNAPKTVVDVLAN